MTRPFTVQELATYDPDLADLLIEMPDISDLSARSFGYVRIWGISPPDDVQAEFSRIRHLAITSPSELTHIDRLIYNRLVLDEEDF